MDKARLSKEQLQKMRFQLYTIGDPCPEFLAFIKAYALDMPTIQALTGIMAVCLCRFVGDGERPSSFVFAQDGIPSVVIEVLGADGATVIDLTAWPLHAPECFAQAVGEADMLGIWNMIGRGGLPLAVHPTPHDWLVAGCQGCVPLNMQWAGHWLGKAGGPFISQDVEHGREVRDLLGAASARYSILVQLSDERQAA